MAGIKLAVRRVGGDEQYIKFQVVHQDLAVIPRGRFREDTKVGNYWIESAAVPDISGTTFYVWGSDTSRDDRICTIARYYWKDLVKSLLMLNQKYTHNTLSEEDVVWE
jgi:hypothetical protein